jgi:predicted metal-dependent phosphotriesterase family hydrolase
VTTNEGQRFPLTGTIDQVRSDIERIKQIGIDHIVFEYNFTSLGRDIDKMIDITKQLSKYAK